MDKKKSTLDGGQSPQKKLNQNADTFLVDEPYNLSERFRNLQNPLKFIESSNIVGLEHKYKNLRGDLKREQESKADFSKSIYKKVISRDNEYNFQNQIESKERDPIYYFNQKKSELGGHQKEDEVKREILQRKFKHGNVYSQQEKKERMREERQIPLTFKHIKEIDTPNFEALRQVEFYSLIKGEDEKGFIHPGNNLELDENIQAHLDSFKHELITQSQYHDKISYQFLFDCDRELQFWKPVVQFSQKIKSEDKILQNCAFLDPKHISLEQMFDFSSNNISIEDIKRFYKLKGTFQQKMDQDKNNDNLEEKYYEAKKRFEEMKQNRLKSKNQRLPAKFSDNVAQTNDQMKEKDFEDYFVQDAKNIFDRLTQLNAIRDRIVEDQGGVNFAVMATNIGIEIGKELFKLLMLVLKGEKFIDYSEFIRAENEQEVEKKILELIYLHFAHFQEYEVNGISKVTIIQKYLQEREKNERFYEAYSIQNRPPDNQRPQTSKKKK